jgi:hypothetical protein
MDPPAWATLRHRFDTAGRWMAVATAFSFVVSTALCTVTMVLFLGFWIASGHYREKLSQIQARPLAFCSLALLRIGPDSDNGPRIRAGLNHFETSSNLSIRQRSNWR